MALNCPKKMGEWQEKRDPVGFLWQFLLLILLGAATQFCLLGCEFQPWLMLLFLAWPVKGKV